MEPAFIALGGNVGPVLQNFCKALDALSAGGQPVLAVSKAYRTAALVPPGAPPGPDYWNAVVAVAPTLGPEALLRRLQGVEAAAGRVRRHRWGPRTLDLDLLLYAQEMRFTPELTLPHGALRSRVFVLRPLCDLAPQRRVPPDQQTVQALLDNLGDPSVGILEVRSDWVRRKPTIAV